MTKRTIILAIAIFFLMPMSPLHAAPLFVVMDDGSVQRNVLGDRIDLSTAVGRISKKVADAAIDGVKEIAFEEIENKTHIKIETLSDTDEQVLGDQLKDLMSIESATPSSKISIQKIENGFSLSQNGVTANTTLPLSITPETKEVFVKVDEEKIKLSVLPAAVLSVVSRANSINIFPPDGTIQLTQTNGAIVYIITGEKAVNLFHLTRITVPVTVTVSANDAAIIHTDQPKWLDLLGFLSN